MSVPDLIAQSLLVMRSDAIIAANRDGVICFWNPGAERIFGYLRGDAIGRSLDLIIPDRLRQRHWDGYRATIATGRSRYGEGDLLSVPALHKNGTTISVEFTIVSLKNESGAMIGMAAIIGLADMRSMVPPLTSTLEGAESTLLLPSKIRTF